MQDLTAEGRRVVEEVAARHGLSAEAAAVLLRALAEGGGTMAQFSHKELGGMGQWSPGGMVMIGDMLNHGLKQRVDAACNDLAGQLRSQTLVATRASASQTQGQRGADRQMQAGYAHGGSGASIAFGAGGSGHGWPAELGTPSATGAQNHLRYAFFPQSRRLALDIGGRVTVYDTGDHQITGFGQQQGNDASLTFTSQHGLVRVADLPIVSPVHVETKPAPSGAAHAAGFQPVPAVPGSGTVANAAARAGGADQDQVLATIERLAGLKEKGILSEEEFQAKKAELLSRL
ncbi:SHOCT domain-containing protein [Geminicoccus flavidas]|uniref:SHOCT domain-containing protein n=1 Tax=Geminicoccus flavidas TaxID=2506407 RepID=UPI00135704FA|nr:SHOCT domain-containing protein [Geminicoccus flavidas]